jgi:hypothetical protein
MDGRSKLVKVLLALPVVNITWALYRLFKSIEAKDTLGIVLAILLVLFGHFIIFILDLVTLIAYDKLLWF